MNMQERMIDTRTFRTAAIAVAAAAVLVLAAYLFGARLRAATSASVAPSALGADSAAAKSASLAELAKSRADFYAELNNSAVAAASSSAGLSAAEYAAKYGVPAASVIMPESARPSSSAADPYQNEWMGFTSPESVGEKLAVAPDPAADPSTSIKPEGINPSAAVDSVAKQYPWIKPEGIKAFGAK